MDVDDHDAAVARVSHLPHLMSVLMAGHLTAVPDRDLLLAGQGLRDVTRIAGSDPQLWEQIVGANSAAVLSELRGVQDQLDLADRGARGRDRRRGAARASSSAASPAPARSRASTARRPAIYRAGRGGDPGRTGCARPGCSPTWSDAGVNVEDIAIEHDQVREVGYLALSVAPDQVEPLVATMLDHGWTSPEHLRRQ